MGRALGCPGWWNTDPHLCLVFWIIGISAMVRFYLAGLWQSSIGWSFTLPYSQVSGVAGCGNSLLQSWLFTPLSSWSTHLRKAVCSLDLAVPRMELSPFSASRAVTRMSKVIKVTIKNREACLLLAKWELSLIVLALPAADMFMAAEGPAHAKTKAYCWPHRMFSCSRPRFWLL